MKRIIGFAYGMVAYGIFFVVFLYLVGFLANFLVPKGIDTGVTLPTAGALAIDIGLMLLFGVQHSVMARPVFKQRLQRLVSASLERSTYVLAASLVLALLLWQWKPLVQVIWQVGGVAAVVLWATYAVGFLLVLLSTFVIDHFDLFGLRQVTLELLRRPYTHLPFKVTFFYRLVRHPLYLGFLLAFWATPHMTAGRLAFAVGMSAYILIAVRYEERDLEAALGESYRRYRSRVPMLVPVHGMAHEAVRAQPEGRGM